jgi:hypothetical protein
MISSSAFAEEFGDDSDAIARLSEEAARITGERIGWLILFKELSRLAAEYRGRNVIERGFQILKQWRALATRYDKHALTYRGGLVLAAILTRARLHRHVLGGCGSARQDSALRTALRCLPSCADGA